MVDAVVRKDGGSGEKNDASLSSPWSHPGMGFDPHVAAQPVVTLAVFTSRVSAISSG